MPQVTGIECARALSPTLKKATLHGGMQADVRRWFDWTLLLDFDWRAPPPLAELRRVVLPAHVALIP